MKNSMKTLVAVALTVVVFHYHEAHASIYYWNQGTGVGSKFNWEKGIGAGSKFYWERGTGAESLDELKFVCYGLMVSKSAAPDISMIYPELEEMN